MLKVVGASSEQTRLSSYVLATLSICGIVIIIFGGKIGRYVVKFFVSYYLCIIFYSFDEEDGIYSATVYWNRFGYRLEFWGQSNSLEEIPRGSARAYYNSDMNGNGWSKLEVETNEFDPDWVQAQSAGLLEGSLTWQHIYYHWQNTINSICEHYEDECEQIRDLIKINTVHTRKKVEELSESDPFWHQIRLYYSQLDGIEMGWRYAVKRSLQNYEIPSEDFIWMNMANDIFDLKEKLGFNFDDSFKNFTLSSAIFKFVNASTDPVIHVAHHTGDTYRAMLRTVKHYNFNFHITNSKISDLVPGTILTFTSYPGVITSLDDFYTITSKQSKHSMVVTSTPLNFPRDFSKDVHLENKLFSSPRVMAANRIATTGLQWMKTFSHNLLEMNNRQWLIFDGMKLEKLGKNVEGLLWLVEQTSGVVRGMDVTKVLLNNSFWASFGAVYFNVSSYTKAFV